MRCCYSVDGSACSCALLIARGHVCGQELIGPIVYLLVLQGLCRRAARGTGAAYYRLGKKGLAGWLDGRTRAPMDGAVSAVDDATATRHTDTRDTGAKGGMDERMEMVRWQVDEWGRGEAVQGTVRCALPDARAFGRVLDGRGGERELQSGRTSAGGSELSGQKSRRVSDKPTNGGGGGGAGRPEIERKARPGDEGGVECLRKPKGHGTGGWPGCVRSCVASVPRPAAASGADDYFFVFDFKATGGW